MIDMMYFLPSEEQNRLRKKFIIYSYRRVFNDVCVRESNDASPLTSITLVMYKCGFPRINRTNNTAHSFWLTKMFIGVVEKHFPIACAHRMFSGTDVISERAVDQLIFWRHHRCRESVGSE